MFGKPVESESTELGMESAEGGGNPSSPSSSSSQKEQPGFVGLRKFQRINQTAVGGIEITIGIVMALTAIIYLAIDIPLQIVALFYWGIIIYIPAGALTIAADKRLTKALVWSTLGMNLLVALSAVAGCVLHFFASVLFVLPPSTKEGKHLRITELVMLVLSIVLFIVSILASAFAVTALCCSRKPLKEHAGP